MFGRVRKTSTHPKDVDLVPLVVVLLRVKLVDDAPEGTGVDKSYFFFSIKVFF